MNVKWNRVEDVGSVQKAVTSELKTVSEESFSRSYKLLYERSKYRVDVEENYIE